jgi:hypothetical protein
MRSLGLEVKRAPCCLFFKEQLMFNLSLPQPFEVSGKPLKKAQHALLLRRGFTMAAGAVAIFDDVSDWSSHDSIANDNMRLVGRGRMAAAHPSDLAQFSEIGLPAPANDNGEL